VGPKKCTKIYNARAQPLFCSINLLFGVVFVAVAIVVCLDYHFVQSRTLAVTFTGGVMVLGS